MDSFLSNTAATQAQGEPDRATDGVGEVRLVSCPLENLRPHPGYTRHKLSVPADCLAALTKLGDQMFSIPLVITKQGIIVDGYARWQLARQYGQSALPCIEYELSEDEALRYLVQLHRRSSGMNDYCRILLA